MDQTAKPKYRLVVGDVLQFDVKFTLRDGAKDKTFGLRLSANRRSLDELEAELASAQTVGDFLAGVNLTMHGWIGNPPLVSLDGSDQPPPPGAEALAVVMDLIPQAVGIILARYQEANGARAKWGN